MPDQSLARELALKHLAAGDAVGWFDELYRAAGGDADVVPWADLAPNPNLVSWLNAGHARDLRGRAMVVGCGLGDDAEELSRLGFDVTAFDISPTAIAWCRRRFSSSHVTYEAADLLALPLRWRRGFDFVFESYTLQALPPDLRSRAIGAVSDLVAPGGQALVICRGRDEGDTSDQIPWPLSRAELNRFVTDGGLREQAFEDFLDENESPPVRRFRAVFHRTP
jgi:SAM-dependent methyltransferase